MTRSLIKTAELPIATGTSASPTCAQDAKRQTAGIFLASSWRPAAGTSGPALLAHILVARYRDQLPLDRQGEIFARMGADIPGATLIDWCGQAAGALRPLVDLIRDVVVASDRIHAEGERGTPPVRVPCRTRSRCSIPGRSASRASRVA